MSDGDRPNILVIWGDDIDQAVAKLEASLSAGQ